MIDLPPPAVLAIPAAAVGLVMGSFVTALSYRQPRAQSVAHGRSKCPGCGHTLQAVDLVPVVSWILQKGACRYCEAPISWRYPAIELVIMVLFAVAAMTVTDGARLALLLAMTVVMVALAVVDLEQQRLPNGFLLALLLLSLAWRWSSDRDLAAGAVTAAAVFAIGVMLNAGFRSVTGRIGLGLGDAKLLAIATLALPLGPALVFLTASGVLGLGWGLVWRRSGANAFPFGPAILASYWASLMAGPESFERLVSRLT